MSVWNLRDEEFTSENFVANERRDGEFMEAEEGGLLDHNHVELHRALKARHITMIGMLDSENIWVERAN
jgi:amino acid permease